MLSLDAFQIDRSSRMYFLRYFLFLFSVLSIETISKIKLHLLETDCGLARFMADRSLNDGGEDNLLISSAWSLTTDPSPMIWDVRRSITLFISVMSLEKSLVWLVIMFLASSNASVNNLNRMLVWQLDVDAVEESVLLVHVPVILGDATEIMLHSAAGWWLITSDDSIGTTTGVSAISSTSLCTSLSKMLRMGV